MEQTVDIEQDFKIEPNMAGTEVEASGEIYTMRVMEDPDKQGGFFGRWVPKKKKGLIVQTHIKHGPEPNVIWAETTLSEMGAGGASNVVSSRVKTADDMVLAVKKAIQTIVGGAAELMTDKQLGRLMLGSLRRAVHDGVLSEALAKRILMERVQISVAAVGKYTIVELTHGGLTFHGLASRHPDDPINRFEGIGRAYSRAFNQLCARLKFGYRHDIILRIKSQEYTITSTELESLISKDC